MRYSSLRHADAMRVAQTAAQQGTLRMQRSLFFFFLLTVCASVNAQSVLFGKRMVSKGDDVARVRDIAGSPSKVDTIPADQYSPAMEIWTYRRKGTTVALWIVAGKVVQAQEQAASEEASSSPARPASSAAR
jgi:cytochrome b subunit of formate dehydrogenase